MTDGFIKSNCRVCGGSIEFPTHGLGEWIDCPHCSSKIQLSQTGLLIRTFWWLRNRWLQFPDFTRKWALVLAAVITVCGTALYIYTDFKAQIKERAKQEEAAEIKRQELLSEQIAEMRKANYMVEEADRQRQLEAKRAALMNALRPLKSDTELEMERANQIAEVAAFQRRMEAMRSLDFQQQQQMELERIRQLQEQEEARRQREELRRLMPR